MIIEDKYLNPADRGCVYDFIEKNGTVKNKVIVVSSNGRAFDKLISVLMLGDSPAGYDVVPVKICGKKYYVHCGMVTYTARAQLGIKLGRVADSVMADIDAQIARNLGIEEEAYMYKRLYNELLDKVTI